MPARTIYLCRLALLSLFFSAISGIHSASAQADLYAPVVDSVRATAESITVAAATRYDLDVTLDPLSNTISGTQRVDFVNFTDQPQPRLPFRLYPNATYYKEGSLKVARVRVDGEVVRPSYQSDDTVMYVPFTTPLAPGGSVSIWIKYTVTVPTDSTGTFGIFSFDAERGTWILADWYPIVAGWEDGVGWHVDPTTDAGDPTFSDVALYSLSLVAPSNLTLAATGTEKSSLNENDLIRWRVVSGPARELTLVLDDDFVVDTRVVGATTVRMFTDGNGAGFAGGQIALQAAADYLPIYSSLFGDYPYTELDLVETEMSGALGVSWTGLVFLNSSRFLANPAFVIDDPARVRFTLAHEVGHQWWGSMIGVNSNDHPFLLEGITNYLAIVGTERADGDSEAQRQLQIQCIDPYVEALAKYGDGIPDTPIAVASDGPPRGTLVYGKAALGFLALREAMGDDAFFGGIRDWAQSHAFRNSEPDELLASLGARTTADVNSIWDAWFESDHITEADVQALVGG